MAWVARGLQAVSRSTDGVRRTTGNGRSTEDRERRATGWESEPDYIEDTLAVALTKPQVPHWGGESGRGRRSDESLRGAVRHAEMGNTCRWAQPPLKLARRFRNHIERRGVFRSGVSRPPRFRKSRPVVGRGREHFVLAEGFEGRGRHAGDGNRLARALKTSMEYPSVPSGATLWPTSFTVSPLWKRRACTSALEIECLKRAAIGLFTSRNGLAPDETDRSMLTPFKLNCAEVAPGIPINSPQTH
jgi:hypothetical protein